MVGIKPDIRYVPVAQLDRVLGYEPSGWGFDSLRARQGFGIWKRLEIRFLLTSSFIFLRGAIYA